MRKSEINKQIKHILKRKHMADICIRLLKKYLKISSDHRTVLDLRRFDYNSLVSFSLEP